MPLKHISEHQDDVGLQGLHLRHAGPQPAGTDQRPEMEVGEDRQPGAVEGLRQPRQAHVIAHDPRRAHSLEKRQQGQQAAGEQRPAPDARRPAGGHTAEAQEQVDREEADEDQENNPRQGHGREFRQHCPGAGGVVARPVP
jgi:hypothetical protein